MGVKPHLLLGIILIGSICGLEENVTNSKNASLENLDSTKNSIEKLPKTDTQINLVNKDTQPNSEDNLKHSKYSTESDSHKNDTSNQKHINKSDSSENDEKGRRENSRSIDLEEIDAHDFQNNDYGISDSRKFLENSIRQSSTKLYRDFSRFQLTTPKSIFDDKFEEAKQKLEQEYEEHASDHVYDHSIDDIDADEHNARFGTLFGEANTKPNSTLDYKEKTKISKNNTVNDGSEYNELTVERTHNINFDSLLNFTTSDEDDNDKMEVTSQKGKPDVTTPRAFFVTTRKTVTLTKPPISPNNHILSNNIETETIKAINLLTTEYSTTKRLKVNNEIIPKEQTVEENKIFPEITEQISTENDITTKIDNEKLPTTTQDFKTTETITDPNKASTISIEENTVTTEINSSPEITSTEIFTHTNIPVSKALTTTINSLESNVSDETNTESSTVNVDITTTTIAQDLNDDTDAPTTVSTTTLATTTEIKDTTISNEDTTVSNEDTTVSNEDTTVSTEDTTLPTTTDSSNRISKAFSFESTFTVTPKITETTTDREKLKMSTTVLDVSNTDNMTVIKTGIVTDTTETSIINETQTEITAAIVNPRMYDTTTIKETHTSDSTPSNMQTTVLDNLTIPITEFSNTLLPSTSTEIPKITTAGNTTVIPTFRNGSISSEDTTTHVSTIASTEDSSETSPGIDAGNLGGGEDGESKGKIAAIVISTVGAVCLILLAGLLYVMRKRQKRFNYKQRCRPVGLEDYSVDNLSAFSSTRRKADRQSKRSYGNPAFDDPVAVTHPLNFTALAKFATNAEDIKAEFGEIPQITAKTNELPEGCETKNRYANVIPLPETRVFLQPIDGYPNSDYINANYVTGPKNTKSYYIACQAPMQNTVDDFWRMVWEQQSKLILMVTHLFENGVEKCVDYLPPSEVLDCNRLFGDFQVTLKKRDVKDKYIISNIQLKNMVSNSWREVTHFWYLGWPEKGVPSEENSIIAFLIEARSYMKSSTLDKNAAVNGNLKNASKTEINPVVIHCSPGTGRTGVVIACDIAIREFEQTRLVDIPKIVYRIRRDRASSVQTKEQYMFIYKVVSLYATKLTGGALESL